MTAAPETPASAASGEHPHDRHHHLVERLIDRLPKRAQAPTRWLRRPSSRWLRIPAGVLLVVGGFLSILPLFGLWMLPLGLLLLAEDVPPLRWVRDRILERIQRHRPHWFSAETTQSGDSSPPAPPAASSNPHA
jgi:hypothetical protein